MQATDKTWSGSGNNWGNGGLWSPTGIPGAGDDIYFDGTNETPIRANGDRAANSLNFTRTASGYFRVGAGASNQTLTLTSGNITRASTNTGGGAIVGDTSQTGGGILTLATGASGFTFTNERGNADLEIQAIISGAGKTATIDGASTGEVHYSGDQANTLTGLTTVLHAGTLVVRKTEGTTAINGDLSISGNFRLESSHQIVDSADITLVSGEFDAGTYSETMGTLTQSGTSILNIGSGSLSFADSSAEVWSGTLQVYNWTEGLSGISFGDSSAALTASQLSMIELYSDDGSSLIGQASLDSFGNITSSAIPEASSFAALSGLLAASAVVLRRRRRS
ncbi:MAG: hypothetical protein ACQKBT_12570 [Puniceicoccales bacterium]